MMVVLYALDGVAPVVRPLVRKTSLVNQEAPDDQDLSR
jgi:hypothetical protein